MIIVRTACVFVGAVLLGANLAGAFLPPPTCGLKPSKSDTRFTTIRDTRGTFRRETVRCFLGGGPKKGAPKNYDEISVQAIAAVQAGLRSGVQAMEVEFPPLGSLNKINDGSAKNRDLAQANTVAFTKKLIGGMGWGKKVWVVCCQPGVKSALTKSGAADVRELSSKNLPQAKKGDVQVVVTPADQGQWRIAAEMSKTATVVIVNGVFMNGFIPFEPVYYFKPISGWGSLVRQYPSPFTAYLAGTNEVVPCSPDLLRAGDVRRPNLANVSAALSKAFNTRAA
ncbi:unnamed protein product [Discosporangium mesarthrocarpum]